MLDQTEKQRLYGELDAVLKEIRGSKFILADIKLNELLKLIALEQELYRLTEYCLKDFSFDLEYMRSEVPNHSEETKFLFRLPAEVEKVVALVFCLLCEFDNKQKDFQAFLLDHYVTEGNYQVGYEAFVHQIVEPYVLAVKTVLEQGRYCEPPEEKKALPQRKFYGCEFVNFEPNAMETLLDVLKDILELIENEPRLAAKDRFEMSYLTEALVHAVLLKDKNLIRALYIGASHTLMGFTNCVAKTSALEKLLKDYYIIT